MEASEHEPEFLLYGASGLIGGRLAALLKKSGCSLAVAQARLENFDQVEKELDAIRPQRYG
jgi:short subunit dehydrogenase-like uncharacterized protein